MRPRRISSAVKFSPLSVRYKGSAFWQVCPSEKASHCIARWSVPHSFRLPLPCAYLYVTATILQHTQFPILQLCVVYSFPILRFLSYFSLVYSTFSLSTNPFSCHQHPFILAQLHNTMWPFTVFLIISLAFVTQAAPIVSFSSLP